MTHNPVTYIETIERLEKDIAMIDAGAFYASAAISLKRIADLLEKKETACPYQVIATGGNGKEYTVAKFYEALEASRYIQHIGHATYGNLRCERA